MRQRNCIFAIFIVLLLFIFKSKWKLSKNMSKSWFIYSCENTDCLRQCHIFMLDIFSGVVTLCAFSASDLLLCLMLQILTVYISRCIVCFFLIIRMQTLLVYNKMCNFSSHLWSIKNHIYNTLVSTIMSKGLIVYKVEDHMIHFILKKMTANEPYLYRSTQSSLNLKCEFTWTARFFVTKRCLAW